MGKYSNTFWLPRVLGILFVCFLTMFSFDVFEMEGTVISKMVGFLIHNIPSIILILILRFSWTNELVGAMGFLIAAIVYVFFALLNAPDVLMALTWSLVIAGPSVVISILFMCERYSKKKRHMMTKM